MAAGGRSSTQRALRALLLSGSPADWPTFQSALPVRPFPGASVARERGRSRPARSTGQPRTPAIAEAARRKRRYIEEKLKLVDDLQDAAGDLRSRTKKWLGIVLEQYYTVHQHGGRLYSTPSKYTDYYVGLPENYYRGRPRR